MNTDFDAMPFAERQDSARCSRRDRFTYPSHAQLRRAFVPSIGQKDSDELFGHNQRIVKTRRIRKICRIDGRWRSSRFYCVRAASPAAPCIVKGAARSHTAVADSVFDLAGCKAVEHIQAGAPKQSAPDRQRSNACAKRMRVATSARRSPACAGRP